MNESLDGWPLIDNKFNQSQTVFDRLFKYQKLGLRFLFTLAIKQNPTQPNAQVITVENYLEIFLLILIIKQFFYS